MNPCLPSSEALALCIPRDLPAAKGRIGGSLACLPDPPLPKGKDAVAPPQEPGPTSPHLHVLYCAEGLAASCPPLHLPGGRAGPAGVMPLSVLHDHQRPQVPLRQGGAGQ